MQDDGVIYMNDALASRMRTPEDATVYFRDSSENAVLKGNFVSKSVTNHDYKDIVITTSNFLDALKFTVDLPEVINVSMDGIFDIQLLSENLYDVTIERVGTGAKLTFIWGDKSDELEETTK
jgi:hypothetical protein